MEELITWFTVRIHCYMGHAARKPAFGVSDHRAVQPQKMARGLKLWIKEVEGLYYLWSENKDADQLRRCRAPDTLIIALSFF